MKQIKFAIFCFLLCACGGSNKKGTHVTLQSLEEKHATGVVLIKNTYYYSIDFDSNLTVYFTGLDKNGNLQGTTFDLEEMKPVTSYGTGFFVSDDGIIATNSHVACPSFSTKDARAAIVNAFNNLAEKTQDVINQQTEKLGELRLLIDAGHSEYASRYKQLTNQRDNNQKLINVISRLNSAECEYMRHCDIGIALNNTHVRETDDFMDCVSIANDTEHDLALLQLKSKDTPNKAHIFKVTRTSSSKKRRPDNDDEDEDDGTTKKRRSKRNSDIGKTLYMIGFNLGPQLALTKEGIKAQITKGEVTQDTDEDHFMYSIPALHGSSGSPIIDTRGKLVAINFAGMDDTQSFNFGIKAQHLAKLLKENSSSD